MNMFKSTSAKTPEEYIEMLDEPRKTDILLLHNLIRKTVPGLKPFIMAGMIGYGPYHYRYPGGREGEWAIIALASHKNYISLYACSEKDGIYIAEKYKKSFPKASIGKSCIRFKKVADIDVKTLEKILLESEKTGGLGQVS